MQDNNIDKTLSELRASLQRHDAVEAEDTATETAVEEAKSSVSIVSTFFWFFVGAAIFGYFISLVWNFAVVDITTFSEMSFLQGVALYLLVQVFRFTDPRKS